MQVSALRADRAHLDTALQQGEQQLSGARRELNELVHANMQLQCDCEAKDQALASEQANAEGLKDQLQQVDVT